MIRRSGRGWRGKEGRGPLSLNMYTPDALKWAPLGGAVFSHVPPPTWGLLGPQHGSIWGPHGPQTFIGVFSRFSNLQSSDCLPNAFVFLDHMG